MPKFLSIADSSMPNLFLHQDFRLKTLSVGGHNIKIRNSIYTATIMSVKNLSYLSKDNVLTDAHQSICWRLLLLVAFAFLYQKQFLHLHIDNINLHCICLIFEDNTGITGCFTYVLLPVSVDQGLYISPTQSPS
jgi:hypothetical protein